MRFLFNMLWEFYLNLRPRTGGEWVHFLVKYVIISLICVAIFLYFTTWRPLSDVRNGFSIAWQNLIAIMTIVCSFLFAAAPVLVWMKEVDTKKIIELSHKREFKIEKMIEKVESVRDFLLVQSVFCLIQVIATCLLIIISWLLESMFLYTVTIFSLAISFIVILSLIGNFSFYWSLTSIKKLEIKGVVK